MVSLPGTSPPRLALQCVHVDDQTSSWPLVTCPAASVSKGVCARWVPGRKQSTGPRGCSGLVLCPRALARPLPPLCAGVVCGGRALCLRFFLNIDSGNVSLTRCPPWVWLMAVLILRRLLDRRGSWVFSRAGGSVSVVALVESPSQARAPAVHTTCQVRHRMTLAWHVLVQFSRDGQEVRQALGTSWPS